MDWLILLAPLLLLPIVFLLVFVGCEHEVIEYWLTVTLVWKPPLKADVAKLQFVAVTYVEGLFPETDDAVGINPNEGQGLRELSITFTPFSSNPDDEVGDYDVIGCDVACVLFDANDKIVGKVSNYTKKGTLAEDGGRWCFELYYTASSPLDPYSISEIACPQTS